MARLLNQAQSSQFLKYVQKDPFLSMSDSRICRTAKKHPLSARGFSSLYFSVSDFIFLGFFFPINNNVL